MNASGFLIPPYSERTEAQVALWDATFDRIQPFLPDLKGQPSYFYYTFEIILT